MNDLSRASGAWSVTSKKRCNHLVHVEEDAEEEAETSMDVCRVHG